MNKYLKIIVIAAVLVVACFAYFSYPVYVGQKRFHDIQSEIEIGMKRELVLALAKDIGYFEHVASQEKIKLNGQEVSVNEDLFFYENFLWPSVLVVEYNSNDLVENINADQ